MATEQNEVRIEVQQERQNLLDSLSNALDRPMIVFAFVWLGLIELIGYRNSVLDILHNGIWAIFVFYFLLEFMIAPRKGAYLQPNWLTALALVLPALRLLRIARLATVLRATCATRRLHLLKVVSTVNRGLRTLGKTMQRHGVTYVITISTFVTFLGSLACTRSRAQPKVVAWQTMAKRCGGQQ